MLIFLVIVMVPEMCQAVPIFRLRTGQEYQSKSIAFSKRLVFQVHSRLSKKPTNKRTMQLCSRNQNVFIQVNPDGVVNGTHDENNKYCKLHLHMFSTN